MAEVDELRKREALEELDDAIAQTYDAAAAVAYLGLKELAADARRIATELRELRRAVSRLK
jgi:hypothetical protein